MSLLQHHVSTRARTESQGSIWHVHTGLALGCLLCYPPYDRLRLFDVESNAYSVYDARQTRHPTVFFATFYSQLNGIMSSDLFSSGYCPDPGLPDISGKRSFDLVAYETHQRPTLEQIASC